MTSFTIAVAFVAALAVVIDAAELTLKPLGELHYKPLGGAMVFTCEVATAEDDEEDTEYTLKWFDANGREISDKTGRRYIEEEAAVKKLYITDIETSDDGVYKCNATAAAGDLQPYEKTVSLRLFKEITFDSAVSPQHPRIHTDALIKCVVSSQPAPDVSWRYKGKRLPQGSKSRHTKVENGLLIRNATLADNGDYTCRAEVEKDGRYDERKIVVEVHVPPTITDGPKKVQGVEGDEVTISCKATSLPPSIFTFFKGGAKLESSSRVQIDETAGVVSFKPLMKEDENSDYNCTANNDVGSDSAAGELKVLVRPSVIQFDNVLQQERKSAKLACSARGDPEPTITFRKVGDESDYLATDNVDSRITVDELGSGRAELTIANVGSQDAGDYQCSVENNVGRNSSVARLTIEYEPVFSPDQATVEHIWAGKTRKVACRPSAEPQAVVEWRRSGQVLSNNGTYAVTSDGSIGYLQVSVREQDQAWIYGIYTCVAINRLGTKEVEIDLKRASVPDAPKYVTTVSRTPTAVSITVEPPEDDGGMPVLGYRVEYNDVSFDFSSVSTNGDEVDVVPPYNTEAVGTATDSNGSNIEIDNLKPSTTYVMNVRAKNEVGLGVNSYKFNITTEDIRKPYPLVISSPKAAESARRYRVTWNKPNNGGRPITQYEFNLRRVKMGSDNYATTEVIPVDENWQEIVRKDVPANPMVHFDIDNLEPDSHYQLKIRSRNDVDWSDYSEHLFRTAPVTKAEVEAMRQSSSSVGTVVIVFIVLLVIVLMVVDLSCYFFNKRGVVMTLMQSLGRTDATSGKKELAIEDGEKEHLTAHNEDNKVDKGNEEENIKLDEIDEKNNTSKSLQDNCDDDDLKKNVNIISSDSGDAVPTV